MGELGANVLSLAELQAKLGWEDLKTASRQAARGLALAVVAGGCALGGIPVVLLGLAELLAETFGWRHSVALFTFGVLTLIVSIIVAVVGARMIFRNFAVFRRSRDELIKNLEWLKQVSRQAAASWNGRNHE
jgi:MFS family permease